jgi:hypothetical protein
MRVRRVAVSVVMLFFTSCAVLEAQPVNALKLFQATPVTESAPCETLGTCSPLMDRSVFDETALLLSCKAHPIAWLSSTADGRGPLVVDDFIEVNGRSVCRAGSASGGVQHCFDWPLQQIPGMAALDAYRSVPPIDVSASMPQKGPGTVTFALVDYGGIYANSDLWLVTNCRVLRKAAICHKPGTPAEKVLTVGVSAIGGHLQHGDSLDVSVCRQ